MLAKTAILSLARALSTKPTSIPRIMAKHTASSPVRLVARHRNAEIISLICPAWGMDPGLMLRLSRLIEVRRSE